MNCEEFKNSISKNSIGEDDLLKHIETCEGCKKWLQKEVSTPPEGVNPEIWASLNRDTSELKETKETAQLETSSSPNENTEGKPEADKDDKSFLDYYLSGLKYGIVFGIAVVIGFSIIQNKNEHQQTEQTNVEQSETTLASDSVKVETSQSK